jgi:ABC-2 type transport system ATP-binding protein
MIEVENLVRSFGGKVVLKSINFTVPRGKICGFVGPNGAGKTTTMRILATLDVPDEGAAKVDNLDIRTQTVRARQKIGFMPDHYGTYSDLIVSEYLDFFARAFQLTLVERKERIASIIDFVELGPILSTRVEGLSKGQRQRLSLARTLLANPEILILDEPAAGLDPRARVELRELLKVLASEGKTIFISSHILSELADLIDWLVIIDAGHIKHCGPPGGHEEHQAEGRLYIVQIESDLDQARRFLLEEPAVLSIEGEGNLLAVRLNAEQLAPSDLLKRLIAHGADVGQFYRRELNLEDVFLKVTGREQ